MMGPPDQDKQSLDLKILVLSEFYIKKGQFAVAKEFLSKLSLPFLSYQSLYLLGKTEFKLKNLQLAASHLERGRSLNPLHKPTLLLLYAIYTKEDKSLKALECMVDLFLLSKEMKDKYVGRYKKKIRDLAQKIDPPIDQKQKNDLVRVRNQHLNKVLMVLEEQTLKIPVMIENSDHPENGIQLEFSEVGSMDLPPLPPNILTKTEPPPHVVENSIQNMIVGIEHVEDTLSMDEKDLNIDDDEAFRNEAIRDISGVKPIETPFHNSPSADTQPLAGIIDDAYVVSDQTEVSGKVIPLGETRSASSTFQKHLVFRSLDASLIEKIQKFAFNQSYKPGESIHQPMDIINGFSCLLEGRVQILHQGKVLLELEAGSILDEAELQIGSKYFFETRALTPSTIVLIDKPSFLTLCKRQHELAQHFLWHFYKSLGLKINSMIDRIITSDANEEVLWGLDTLQEVSQHRTITLLDQHILEKKFVKKVFNKNDFIFKNQDIADTFYILLEGRVDLSHPESGEYITVKPLEYFSEISLISNAYEHILNAKIESDTATLLSINREQLNAISDPSQPDQYRMIELLWKILSWKYFEFLNFYFHYAFIEKEPPSDGPINPFVRI